MRSSFSGGLGNFTFKIAGGGGVGDQSALESLIVLRLGHKLFCWFALH